MLHMLYFLLKLSFKIQQEFVSPQILGAYDYLLSATVVINENVY